MYNSKFRSYKYILERLYTDFPFQYNFQNSEIIEWLDSALRDLSINRYYVDKITDGNLDLNHQLPIEIVDNRGKLPCDLLGITQVAYMCEDRYFNVQCSPVYAGGLVYYDYNNGTSCTTGQTGSPCTTLLDWPSCACNPQTNELEISCADKKSYRLIPMRYNTSTMYQGAGHYSDSCNSHCTNINLNTQSELVYEINNDTIVTNFREGKVMMAYRAIPVDSEGYPMVPDDNSVIEFILYSLATRIAFKLYWMDKIDSNKFDTVAITRDIMYKKAIGKTQLSNKDYLASFTNERLRSFKYPLDHKQFFAFLGTLPQVYQQPTYQQIRNFN